jgi:hypothetical protein
MSSTIPNSEQIQALRICHGCEKCYTQSSTIQLKDKEGKLVETVKKLDACARCRIAKYCSKECQKTHWQYHKKTCQPIPSHIDLDKYSKLIDKAIHQSEEDQLSRSLDRIPIGMSFSLVTAIQLDGHKAIVNTPYRKYYINSI